MSGSFFAVDPAWWPAMRERLPKPLSLDEACADLRYWQDRELQGIEEMPSYRELGASWGWSAGPQLDCKKARNLVKSLHRWSDPLKLAKWKAHRGISDEPNNPDSGPKGRNEGATRAQRGRNEGANHNSKTPALEGKGRNEGATRAQEGRTEGDTREPLSSHTQTQAQAQGGTRARATETTPPWSRGWAPHEPEAVIGFVKDVSEAIRGEAVGDGGIAADSAPLQALWRHLGTPTLEDLSQRARLVAAWAQEAPDSRNDLRGIDERGKQWGSDRSRVPTTVLKADRFEERYRRALAWDRAGRPTGSTAPPPKTARRQSLAGDGALAELLKNCRKPAIEVKGG